MGAITAVMLPFYIGLTVLAVLCDAQAPVEIYPQNPVVLEGQNLTMLCRVGVDVHYCRITIPGLKNSLNLKSGQRVGGYEYYGAGLEQGQCGVHIGSVTAKEAGEFKCSMGTSPIESDASTTIIVAREPSPPEMETSPGTQARDTFRANDILTARCVVRDGRPPANISWYLDDEPIYDGLSEPQVIDTPDGLATSVQNITRRLQPNDDGRRLTCVARHLAYRKPNQASVIHHIIKVQYEPLPRERPIGIFGVTLGELAYINVTIEANPRPVLEWTVNGESIPEGSIDSTQRFEVTSAQPLGQNRYNATLRISDLTLEDTTKEYRLRARNEIGMTEYEIRISSSEPPMGGVLDLGSIVGIVVALAIVLIVVILIIFARATGRWCFHGSTENTDVAKTRHVGETSPQMITLLPPSLLDQSLRPQRPGQTKRPLSLHHSSVDDGSTDDQPSTPSDWRTINNNSPGTPSSSPTSDIVAGPGSNIRIMGGSNSRLNARYATKQLLMSHAEKRINRNSYSTDIY